MWLDRSEERAPTPRGALSPCSPLCRIWKGVQNINWLVPWTSPTQGYGWKVKREHELGHTIRSKQLCPLCYRTSSMNSMSYDHPCWWEKLGSWMKGSSLWICGEDAKVNEPIYTFFFLEAGIRIVDMPSGDKEYRSRHFQQQWAWATDCLCWHLVFSALGQLDTR